VSVLHEFEPARFHVSVGSHKPVLRVERGEVTRTWTVDSGGYDRNGEDNTDGDNPQTGLLYLEGAAPRDFGLDHRAGSALLGHRIRYDVGNVYDPANTVVAKVEKAILERL